MGYIRKMDASKGASSQFLDASVDPLEDEHDPGHRETGRPTSAAPEAFLVCHPVAVLLVNGKAMIRDDVPPDVALAAPWTAVIDAGLAGESNRRFLPGEAMLGSDRESSQGLIVLPGGDEKAAASLRSALANPELIEELRRRLRRLGTELASAQTAAAVTAGGASENKVAPAAPAPLAEASLAAAGIRLAGDPAATGGDGGGDAEPAPPSLIAGVRRLPKGLRRLARLVRKRLGRAKDKTTRARVKSLDRDVKELFELLQRTSALEARLESEGARIDWALGSTEGITEQVDAYLACRETDGYRAAFASPTPLVSVCVATMDRADVLVERALASLRQQTYRNLQVIVVGDHCTDDTAQRIAAIGDSRIQFVNLPERGPYPHPGLDRWYVAGSNAMNHALSLCEGQFITHLDDDDAMVPHRIETLVAAALTDQADFLWHPFWYEQCDGTWRRIGDGRLQLGQVSTGSIFYHRYFAQIRWDVHAYRLREPGDWNRIRKIKLLRPRTHFVDEPLLYHHQEQQAHAAFIARDGERFLN